MTYIQPKYTKFIYDAVHGNIGITEAELKIIDTSVFQRLHRIKQLGPANMVYPGASHSRFAHSIGAMFVMGEYLQHVTKEGSPIVESYDNWQKLRLAALLHDVGHYPFSHSLEVPIKEKFNGHEHEDHSVQIIKTVLKEKLDTYTPNDIISIIEKTHPNHIYSTLISSEMDVDKVDYLLRDSYHTGVGYGKVDVDRLLRTMSFDNEGNIIFNKVGPVIENFLLGRYHMYQSVYNHKVVIAFEQMIERIYELLVQAGKVMHPNDILTSEDETLLAVFDDDYLWQAMHVYHRTTRHGFLSELIRAVLNRTPLALSVQIAEAVEKGKFPEGWSKILLLKEQESKRTELSNKAGLGSTDWIFPYVQRKPISVIPDDIPVFVKTNNGTIPIEQDKTLVITKLLNVDFHIARIYTKNDCKSAIEAGFANM